MFHPDDRDQIQKNDIANKTIMIELKMIHNKHLSLKIIFRVTQILFKCSVIQHFC